MKDEVRSEIKIKYVEMKWIKGVDNYNEKFKIENNEERKEIKDEIIDLKEKIFRINDYIVMKR